MQNDRTFDHAPLSLPHTHTHTTALSLSVQVVVSGVKGRKGAGSMLRFSQINGRRCRGGVARIADGVNARHHVVGREDVASLMTQLDQSSRRDDQSIPVGRSVASHDCACRHHQQKQERERDECQRRWTDCFFHRDILVTVIQVVIPGLSRRFTRF